MTKIATVPRKTQAPTVMVTGVHPLRPRRRTAGGDSQLTAQRRVSPAGAPLLRPGAGARAPFCRLCRFCGEGWPPGAGAYRPQGTKRWTAARPLSFQNHRRVDASRRSRNGPTVATTASQRCSMGTFSCRHLASATFAPPQGATCHATAPTAARRPPAPPTVPRTHVAPPRARGARTMASQEARQRARCACRGSLDPGTREGPSTGAEQMAFLV